MEYGLTEGYMSVNVVTFDSQPVNQESRSSSFHERLIRYNCEDIIVGQIFYNENQRDHKSEKIVRSNSKRYTSIMGIC